MFLVGRLIGVCSLLTSMQNLGSPVFGIGAARWPDGPPQSGVAQEFNLIPVSGVGEAVGAVSEAVGDEKIGGNGVEGTFNKDMTNDEMTFEAHKHKPLSQTCDHIWRASPRSEKKCPCVRTVRCCLYTYTGWNSWVTFMEHARNNYQCLPVVSARLLQPYCNAMSHTETTGTWNLQHKRSVEST